MLIKIYESYGAVDGGGAKAQPLHPKTLPKKNLLHQSGVSHRVLQPECDAEGITEASGSPLEAGLENTVVIDRSPQRLHVDDGIIDDVLEAVSLSDGSCDLGHQVGNIRQSAVTLGGSRIQAAGGNLELVGQ